MCILLNLELSYHPGRQGQFYSLSLTYYMIDNLYVKTNAMVNILEKNLLCVQQNLRRSSGCKVEVPKMGWLVIVFLILIFGFFVLMIN